MDGLALPERVRLCRSFHCSHEKDRKYMVQSRQQPAVTPAKDAAPRCQQAEYNKITCVILHPHRPPTIPLTSHTQSRTPNTPILSDTSPTAINKIISPQRTEHMATISRVLPPTRFSPLFNCVTSITRSRSLPFHSVLRRPSSFSLKQERRQLNSSTFKKEQFASMAEVKTTTYKDKVQVFDSEEVLALALAKYVAQLSDQFAKERGAFTVVLSGGSLIKSLRKLVEAPYLDSVDWSKWHVLWVDERVVPKNHPDSNYFLAYNDFLSKIPIPAGNVYAINDALPAEAAADDYETCLKHLVKCKTLELSEASGFPKFDLILLGMGPDGHIASLFPGHRLVQENKWVTFVKDSPKPPPERITFTLPVVNCSANIALVVAGAGKADAVRATLGDDQNSAVLPVQKLSPEGMLSWFLDKGAASKL